MHFTFKSLAIIIGVVYLASLLYFRRWEVNIIYGGDTWGYYAYLPAALIYGDLSNIDTTYRKRFDYSGEAFSFPGPGGELPVAANGHRVIKYTAGVALLQLPFFLMGHGMALLLPGVAADGYSWPYMLWIHLANLIYFFAGLWCLYRVLQAEVLDKQAVWFSLLILALGTHLYNFEVYRGPMAHAYLFSLYGLLMYASRQFYLSTGRRYAILIGLSAGLITLIRPVEILALAIPLGYGLVDGQALRQRWAFWKAHAASIGWAVVVFIAMGLPQLLYWKLATGGWHFDGYPGEAFDFRHARIHGGLFSYQNGWLTYSPAMWLSVLGIGWLAYHRRWLWPVLIFLPLHIYIAYSWWCWYYINGFGSRPMVEAAALLSVPMAFTVAAMLSRPYLRVFFYLLTAFFIGLNLFQNWQHKQGILWTEAANEGYYWAVFGKTKMTYDALVAFDTGERQPDSSQLKEHALLYSQDFEAADSSLQYAESPVGGGKQAALLTPERKYLEFFAKEVGSLPLQAGDYLRVEAMCKKDVKEYPWYTAPSIVVSTQVGEEVQHYRALRIDSKLANPTFSIWGGEPGHWGWVRFYVKLPETLAPEQLLKVYAMAEKEVVYVDQVKVSVLKGP